MSTKYIDENITLDLGEIYFAGGCFWGVEGYFQKVKGVLETEVGYANGESDDTSYEEIDKTGHAETVMIKYNKNRITLEELLIHYFRIIDPISLNKQGNDIGTQYRTGIYYVDDSDREIIDSMIDYQQKKYSEKILVEVEKLKNFVLAEDYHQDYLINNPKGYCHINLNDVNKPLLEEEYIKPDKEVLKEKLSELEFLVTQEDYTESPYLNKYNSHYEKGIYVDVVTGEPLFLSSDKFESGCGWPSFTRPIVNEVVKYDEDNKYNMTRTEVRSRAGDSHLGHVFSDGPKEKGGLRYCINSAALRFIPVEDMEKEGYGKWISWIK